MGASHEGGMGRGVGGTGFAAAAAGLSLMAGVASVFGQCTPGWDREFLVPGILGPVASSVMYDDGSGPALYLGGPWTVNGSKTSGIAKSLDGKVWHSLDGGLWQANNIGNVNAMRVLDMGGPRPVLVVGGQFFRTRPQNSQTGLGIAVSNIAIWDGSSWAPMGDGLQIGGFNFGVSCLEIFDSGSGPQLYAGGDFEVPGFAGLKGLAMWDGAAWVSVGNAGIPASFWVRDMTVFNDGSGPALYVAGAFPGISGVSGTDNIARWNGTAWSGVGGGLWSGDAIDRVIPFGGKLWAIKGYDNKINAWNGAVWEGEIMVPQSRSTVAVFDDGSGTAMYFGPSGGASTRMTRFNGTSFTEVGDPMRSGAEFGVGSGHLGVHTLGGTPVLFAAGASGTDAAPVSMLEWKHQNWSVFGGQAGGMVQTLDDQIAGVQAVAADAKGYMINGVPNTVLSGTFGMLGGVELHGLGAFDGSTWSPVAGGVAGAVSYGKLLTRSEAGGSTLYVIAKGYGTSAGTALDAGVHVLRSGTWSSVGADFGFRLFDAGSSAYVDPSVTGFVSGNVGHGEQLFVFGQFNEYAGSAVDRVATWNGSQWVQVGTLSSGDTQAPTSGVMFNDGSGNALYVGGGFTGRLARWDGNAWTTVATGLPAAGNPMVFALNGQLWATSSAWTAGSTLAGKTMKLYRWDGAAALWSLQATTPATTLNGLKTSSLFPVGVTNVDGVDRLYIANYHVQKSPGADMIDFDGTQFTSDASMGVLNATPTFVSSVTSGGASSLWFGGVTAVGGTFTTFQTMDATSSVGVARWFCPLVCSADFNGDSVVDFFDYLDFVDAFSSQASAADFNHDDVIDFFDYLDFVDAFSVGC